MVIYTRNKGTHRVLWWPIVSLLLLLMTGCATLDDRVAPIPSPDSQQGRVEVAGVKLAAIAYLGEKPAKEAFGFDIRGAGLLPVRVVMDNQSRHEVRIVAAQTFLIDSREQAWPLLSAEQANQRVADHVEVGETARGATRPALMLGAAGALAGMAVGVISGDSVGEAAAKGAVLGGTAGALGGGFQRHQEIDREVSSGLAQQSLRNQHIKPGDLGFGFLFFPGKDEARSAVRLRLALEIGGQRHVVQIPVSAPPAGER